MIFFTVLLFVFAINGHTEDLNSKEDMACNAANGIQPFCSFNRPEDMVLIPESHFLIVSEIGSADYKQGNRDLILFDTQSKEQSVLYPDKSGNATNRHYKTWGDKGCEEPAWFAPHGIDITRRPDGKLELFVVNHGEKESIQMFSVDLHDGGVKLEWRGCVNFEVGNSLNDVAALPGGGFVTGSTVATDESRDNLTGLKTDGIVFIWTPEAGLSSLATLKNTYLNGVLALADGLSVFVNGYREASEVVKISVKTGEIEGTVKTRFYADNNSWSDSGQLLVATIGSSEGLNYSVCDKSEAAFCALPFEILSIDPDTMASTVIFSHPSGQPFGQATVAVQVGGELYLGASTGNRIAKIKMPLKELR